MGNEVSTSEQSTEFHKDPISFLNSLKKDLGISKLDSSGLMDTASKIAYDPINNQFAFISNSGDIQVFGDQYNRVFKQTKHSGMVDFFDFSGDGLGLIIIYSNRRIEYFSLLTWEKKVIMDDYWTEEKIVCFTVSRYYLTNYFYIGLSNGYVRIFNTTTCQLLLDTITPTTFSIKKYNDTLLSILPLDFSPNLILITYKTNGVYLYDLYAHKAITHYKQMDNCGISAISILPHSMYFLVAYDRHLYVYIYTSASPVLLDTPSSIYMENNHKIENIYVLTNDTSNSYTYITKTVSMDQSDSQDKSYYYVASLKVSESFSDLPSNACQPISLDSPRDMNILHIYCTSLVPNKQENSKNVAFILEGNNIVSYPPYLYKLTINDNEESKDSDSTLEDNILTHIPSLKSKFVTMDPAIDLFTYSFPSMSEHTYTTIYSYVSSSGEYSATYLFNCYANGYVNVYQRIYDNYNPYSFLFTINTPKYSSLLTPAPTYVTCLSCDDTIRICISFYTGEIQLYEWDLDNEPELLYSSSHHMSQPVSFFLTHKAIYHINTFGVITCHNYVNNEITEISLADPETEDINFDITYPTAVSFYGKHHMVLGFNNGGLCIYNTKRQQIEYNMILWEGQDDNYLSARSLAFVTDDGSLYVYEPNFYNSFNHAQPSFSQLKSIYLLSDSSFVLFSIQSESEPQVFSFASPLLSFNSISVSENQHVLMLIFQDLSLCLYDHIQSCYGYRTVIPVDKRILGYQEIYETQSHLSKEKDTNEDDSINVRGDLFESGYKLYIDRFGHIYIYVGTGETFIYSIFKEDPQPFKLLEKEDCLSKQKELLDFCNINCAKLMIPNLQAFKKTIFKISSIYSLFQYLYQFVISYDKPHSDKSESEEQEKSKDEVYLDQIHEEEQKITQLFVELNKLDIYDHDTMLYEERKRAWDREKEKLYKEKKAEQDKIDSDKRWNELQARMNESRRLLHERGEALSKMVTVSQRLDDASAEFYNMAKELRKQQEKQSKFFGFF